MLDLVEALSQIEQDSTVPRNVKLKLKSAMGALQEEDKELRLKANKALQELDDISDDPNIPPYIRPQIWNVVSLLESI
jgi:uncharacterized protein (UPF0147 family)